MSRSTVIVLLLTGLVTLSGVCAGSDSNANQTQTPQNVIGLVDETVILECSRNVPPGEITWKYIPHGSSEEKDIPSARYRFETSNYGVHRLILEHLQLADVGVYVCRSVSNKFDGAVAYVVVVAYGPFCYSNLTTSVQELTEGDAVKMTCVVTYASIPGVDPSLTWTQTGGNFTLSKDYTSSPTGTSFHSLTAVVRAEPPSLSQYSCKVAFHHTSKRPDDEAQNIPDFFKGSTCVSPDRHIVVVHDHHNSSPLVLTEKVSLGDTYKDVLIVVSVLAGTVIIALSLLYLSLRKRRCVNVRSSAEDPVNENRRNERSTCEREHGMLEIPRLHVTELWETLNDCTECNAASGSQVVDQGEEETNHVLEGSTTTTVECESTQESQPASETQRCTSPDRSENDIDLINSRSANGESQIIAETAINISENQPVQSTSEQQQQQQQQQQQATSDLQLSSQNTCTATEDEIDSSENDRFLDSPKT